jgi:hypothetical protein
MNMKTRWTVVARQFAMWGLVGFGGLCADFMVLHHGGWVVLLLPMVSCLVGGAMAGRGLGAGAVGAFACAVTFAVGGLGALLSSVATQAMGGETALDLVWFFGVYYAVAFGAGAAIGFAFAPRHGLPVFVDAVQWFSLGGAVAGAVIGMLVAFGLGHAALSVAIGVAVDAAFATGGAGVAYALGKQADSSHNRVSIDLPDARETVGHP